MKLKIKEINIEFCESQIFIFWDCKPIDAGKYLEKHITGLPDTTRDYLFENDENSMQGVCLSHPGKNAHCVIWLSRSPEEDKGRDVFVHEITHAAHAIMRHWGIPVTEDTSEILSMLTGFITKKFYQKKK